MAQSKSLKYVILFSLLFVGAVVLGDVIGNIKIQTNTISSTNTNGDITFDPNGTGKIIAVGNIHLPTQGDLRFEDSAGGEYVAIQAPATVGSNLTFTLPSADGSNNQVLKTNGSGVLSFTDNGITAIGAVGSSANANGMTLTSGTLNLEPASASFGGVVTTGSQTFAGSKRFPDLFSINRAATTGSFTIQSNGTNYDSAFSLYSSNGTYKHQWYPETNGYFYIKPDALTIFPFMYDNAGKVGIGTGSPEAQLTVGVAADVVQLSVKSNGTQTSNLIQTKDTGGTIVTKVEADGDAYFTRLFAGTGLAFTNASTGLELKSTSLAFVPSRMTSSQQNALTGTNGMLLYNTDANQFKAYKNSVWGPVGDTSISGGYNILAAPTYYNWNAESGDTTSWSETGGGTLASTSTAANVAFDTYAISYDASANNDYLATTAVTVPPGLYGANCQVVFYYKGFDSNITASVTDGTNTLASSALVASTNYTKHSALTFVCPSSGTLQVRWTASADAAIGYVDNVHLGQNLDVGTAAQAELVGTITYAGASNCLWARTGVGTDSYGNFSADTDCAAATVTGAASAPGTKIPAIVLSNIGPGNYQFFATGIFAKAGANDAGVSFRFNDGTNSSASSGLYGATALQSTATLFGEIQYTTGQSSVTVNIQALTANTSNTVQILTNVVGNRDLKISVYRYPLAAETVFKADTIAWKLDLNISGANIDLDTSSDKSSYVAPNNGSLTMTINTSKGSASAGISCSSTNDNTVGSTTCSAGSEEPGFVADFPRAGLVEVCYEFSHKMVTGASGNAAVTFQVTRTANGSQTIAEEGGDRATSTLGTASTHVAHPVHTCGTLQIPSAAKHTIRLMYEQDITATLTTDQMSADALSSEGQRDIHITARYIDQAMPAPLIKNSVTTTSSGVTGMEVASLNCDSGSAINSQHGSWVASIGNISSGSCAVTFTAGTFSATPYCFATINLTGGGRIVSALSASSSGVTLNGANDAGTALTTFDANLMCVGAK